MTLGWREQAKIPHSDCFDDFVVEKQNKASRSLPWMQPRNCASNDSCELVLTKVNVREGRSNETVIQPVNDFSTN